MGSTFRFLEDIALADMAFEVVADSPSELFEGATRAMIETLADPATVGRSWEYVVDRNGDDLPSLLFEWLEEMVYLKDAHGVVYHEASLHLDQHPEARNWHLGGRLSGAPVDVETQSLRSDVKGVTKHLYGVMEESGGWRARVVLDV